MLLGFQTQLVLNNQQRSLLSQHAGVARHAFNEGLRVTKAVLDHNKANPTDKIKFPSAIDLHKWLVASIKPGGGASPAPLSFLGTTKFQSVLLNMLLEL